MNNGEFFGNVDLEDIYYIYDDVDEHITEDSIVWVNTNKTIWEGRVIKIPFSVKSKDAKHLKLIRINKKMEERVLIKNCSKEYKHKRIPVSTQIYQDGGGTEKSVLDLKDSLRHQKLGLTKSDPRDVQGIFIVKLHAQKSNNNFLNTQLTLNEDGTNLDK